ncbi:hypothetical protein TRVA0_022S00496 [Trichomonascus vanleenenianus]|uniref:alpha-ketoglutarate-dependent dioxygenase AlkB n=1 Tax=Trichomonascus vanleenenianus TaxID=2268995 RepID=UPI003ECABA68
MTVASAVLPEQTTTDEFKPLYKLHRHLPRTELGREVLDSAQPHQFSSSQYTPAIATLPIDASAYFARFAGGDSTGVADGPPVVVTVDELPGLRILPQFFPPCAQRQLVSSIVEEYVPNPQHLSNLDLHYIRPSPLRLFPLAAGDADITVPHKEPGKKGTSIEAIRSKQLRWITLGGQYNWTTKVYPTFEPGADGFPQFPAPLADLLEGLFGVKSEAAIVNFYSPGDILSPHQDVAELSNADLISVSIGCDCIFYCGKSRNQRPLQVLLRSGDVIIMGGESRKAFHGVGRVFADTCPAYLSENPGWDYNDWISSKRINVNVRQMLNY